MQPNHAQIVLTRETAHLVGADRDQVQLMLLLARLMAAQVKDAPTVLAVEAITLKLLTMHPGSERWVRLLVARAALEIVRPVPTPLAA